MPANISPEYLVMQIVYKVQINVLPWSFFVLKKSLTLLQKGLEKIQIQLVKFANTNNICSLKVA